MKIVVVSDWHLIGPGKKSILTSKDYIVDFLKWAQEVPDLVVFAGDIFDTKLDSWENIMKSHKDVAQVLQTLIKKKKAHYIFGNHDLAMEQRWNLPETFQIPGTQMIVMHEHQFNYEKRWMNRIEKKIAGVINAFKCTQWILQLNKKPLFYKRALRFLKNNPHYSHIIYGHAHQAYIGEDGVMNCGCCLNGDSEFLYIVDGKPRICKMSDGFTDL